MVAVEATATMRTLLPPSNQGRTSAPPAAQEEINELRKGLETITGQLREAQQERTYLLTR